MLRVLVLNFGVKNEKLEPAYMQTMKTKFCLFFGILFFLSSCFKEHVPNTSQNKEEFKNNVSINVDISSKNGVSESVSIFFDNPWNKDGKLLEPCLKAKTNIQTSLTVPKHVKKLTVIKGGELTEHPVSDLIINDTKTFDPETKTNSDAGINFKKVVDLTNNEFFPERSHNIKGSELYKCTDLTIKDDLSESEFKEAEVFITYLSDGFFSKSDMYGKLWAYSYLTDKRANLTIDDCTFYGLENGAIVEVAYSDINKKMMGDELDPQEKPIFWSYNEQKKVEKAQNNEDYTTINIGKFGKGVSIGFVFKGDLERCQFTTPALNISDKSDKLANGTDHNYIGHTINYNGSSFKIDKNISNGFIYNTVVDGKSINILGMENRTPNYKAYDGDYNDMLCYVYSSPIIMEPEEPLTPPIVGTGGEYTREKGLYLFEDNYPNEGDYDFNDVVISYEIFDYFKTSDKKKDVIVQVLATGANRINEFGFRENGENKAMVSNLTGKKNVYKESFSTDNYSEVYRETFYGEIKPYLANGINYIYDDSFFNTGSYPYVLIIPSTGNADKDFRWCVESKRIDKAYRFKAPRADDWYITPANEDLIIERPVVGDNNE